MADMKKRRFLSALESNELSRQVTHQRLKHTGVLAAAQKPTADPELSKLFAAINQASAAAAPAPAKAARKRSSVKTAKGKARVLFNEDTLKKLAGF